MRIGRLALVLLLLGGPCVPLAAGEDVPDAPRIEDAWIEDALAAAGPNAPELQRVLDHFRGDPRKSLAARFLIAHMPDKGYIRTELRTQDGQALPFDPLAYDRFPEALEALEALEKTHGELDFAREDKVEDVRTMTAAYLIRHIDLAFAAWERVPAAQRVGFRAFLAYVLPYRGSQEPLDAWLEPLMRRYAGRLRQLADGQMDAAALYQWLSKDVHRRVQFDERYYLHPTDQGFTEMGRSGQGRCEDITNMVTFAARSMALATAADYTPAWAHSDNNHAWNVLLDKHGRGFARGNAHAAKVYRKTFAIQRDALVFRLPDGREAPNRFLASPTYVDVTDQYAPTSDVTVALDANTAQEAHAYLCVFNGGNWVAIHWSPVENGRAAFDRMGRGILYLPAVHDGMRLVPAGHPLLVGKDGRIRTLSGGGAPSAVTAVAVRPKKVSPDTHVETPISYLKAGETYVLRRWAQGAWADVQRIEATAEPARFERLPADALYWLVVEGSRRLERPWTVTPEGRQCWW